MEKNQNDTAEKTQLSERVKKFLECFDIVNIKIDENTAKKLQNHFTKKSKDKTSLMKLGPSRTRLAQIHKRIMCKTLLLRILNIQQIK